MSARRTVSALALAAAVLFPFVPTGSAETAPAGDAVLDTMARWTATSSEKLRLDGAPAPHRVVTVVADIVAYGARAEFGGIVYESPRRDRQGRVEVVVGDDRLDSSRFKDPRRNRWGGSRATRQQITVAVGDDQLPLERDLWHALDASYKQAVQQWQAKVAAREAQGGDQPPPDWGPAEPIDSVDLAPLAPIDEAALRRIAVEASRALREVGPLDRGEVDVSGTSFRFYTVTSEGTRIVQPEGYAAVQVKASLVRDDGVRFMDEMYWVRRRVSDLPPGEEIVEGARSLGENMLARAGAESVEYYEGPVIFEDHAAADFLRYLVTPEILGTPPTPEAGRSYQRQTRSGPRLGRRLLPDGWTVIEDASRTPAELLAKVTYDREGVAVQPVRLVEDGFVRDFVTSRIPRDEESRSNGHARGSVTGSWVARPFAWTVTAPKILSDRAFDRAVKRTLDRGRQERILVVRRMLRAKLGQLPSPSLAFWRDADGSEVAIGSLEFQNVDRRMLRNIAAAAGGEFVHAYLAPWKPGDYPGGETGLPTVLTVPRRLLVEEMELVFPGPSEKPHVYPRPPGGGS